MKGEGGRMMDGREDREARGIREEGLREGGMEGQRSLSNMAVASLPVPGLNILLLEYRYR